MVTESILALTIAQGVLAILITWAQTKEALRAFKRGSGVPVHNALLVIFLAWVLFGWQFNNYRITALENTHDTIEQTETSK